MKTRTLYLSALAVALSACSSVPERNAALDQTRNSFESARANPEVTALAPDELQRADRALRLAEQAHANRDKAVVVDHLAYLADRHVVIAQETASIRAAQAITAEAAANRDKLRLAARTQEADTAQQRVSDLEEQLKGLNAKKTDRGIVVTLGDILFDSGQSRISAIGAGNVSKLAEVFRNNPQVRASIEGHTDNVGSNSSNQLLSERRAKAVMAALQSQGVAASRLSTQGYGEDVPVADNGTASGRQMNRRVEIVFAPQTGE